MLMMLMMIMQPLLLQSHTLEGLAVYTQYLLSIKVYNPEGSGPETIVVVMTDEGGSYIRSYTCSTCSVFQPHQVQET